MKKIATPLIIAFVLALLSSFAKSNNSTATDKSTAEIVAIK